jgi:hypothetical protein
MPIRHGNAKSNPLDAAPRTAEIHQRERQGMTLFHTITRERTVATGPLGIATIDAEEEIELTIEGRYYGGCRGSTDHLGVPLEPDDPKEFEITSVAPDIELTEKEEDAIREKAFEQASEDLREYERD